MGKTVGELDVGCTVGEKVGLAVGSSEGTSDDGPLESFTVAK